MGRQLIVIGGGVIGCSVAWHLTASSDYDVVLIERDRLGSGTTWHSAGNITWRPGAQHDEMVVYALDVIHKLTAETGQETGAAGQHQRAHAGSRQQCGGRSRDGAELSTLADPGSAASAARRVRRVEESP